MLYVGPMLGLCWVIFLLGHLGLNLGFAGPFGDYVGPRLNPDLRIINSSYRAVKKS